MTTKENARIRWKLQEEDREFQGKQNADHHSYGVLNKTIDKICWQTLIKRAGDNLDKYTEVIIDDSEEKY